MAHHLNFDATMILLIVVIENSIMFLLCFFGKIATDSFAEMGDISYGADWQNLSPALQRYFIVIIANAQQPLYYDGFGVAILNLEMFQRVSLF